MNKIRVLVCDDSALMRRALRKIIESDPDLEVIDTARDGDDAVAKARELRPDVITMDINMPGMDGITAMQIILSEEIAPVLMVSSLTQEGASITFEALALGAFDYVPKPGGTVSVDMMPVARELTNKIKAAAKGGTLSKLRRKSSDIRKLAVNRVRRSPDEHRKSAGKFGFKVVAIGVSTGGPKTLFDVLPFLPADLNATVFLVQHMPPTFTESFAKRINTASPMDCMQAEAGMPIKPGAIYLGKGGCHLTAYKKLTGEIIVRTPTRPEHTFVPSVDVMMESVLELFGSDTIGVLLTGMGDDGARSMVKIKEAGGFTIAESEESAIVFGMPAEAIHRGGAHVVAPSWQIADEIIKAVERNKNG
jgi:two-component system chemotaxis response regulator CheB